MKVQNPVEFTQDLKVILDTIWITEQPPLTLHDSLMVVHNLDSKEAQIQQEIYEKNHVVNEKRIRTILDRGGWPNREEMGELGNWTICNVIQHADNDIRIKSYL